MSYDEACRLTSIERQAFIFTRAMQSGAEVDFGTGRVKPKQPPPKAPQRPMPRR